MTICPLMLLKSELTAPLQGEQISSCPPPRDSLLQLHHCIKAYLWSSSAAGVYQVCGGGQNDLDVTLETLHGEGIRDGGGRLSCRVTTGAGIHHEVTHLSFVQTL